jgi:hypothetical protein
MPPVADFKKLLSLKFTLLSAYHPKFDSGYATDGMNYAKQFL